MAWRAWGTNRGIVPREGLALFFFFFLFSLYSLWAVFIVGTSGTPLVRKVPPVVSSTNCSRAIQKAPQLEHSMGSPSDDVFLTGGCYIS